MIHITKWPEPNDFQIFVDTSVFKREKDCCQRHHLGSERWDQINTLKWRDGMLRGKYSFMLKCSK